MSILTRAEFVEAFLLGRTKGFLHDVEVCLVKRGGKCADFPGLMTCISFAELMSGLHTGKLKDRNEKHLIAFAARFMDSTVYDAHRLTILYKAFRHKLAHGGHPYAVFDTAKELKVQKAAPQRITWSVHDAARRPAIEVLACAPGVLPRTTTPWEVPYSHRIHISVRSLADDLADSVRRPNGFLTHVRSDKTAEANFWKCMETFYPQ